MRRKAKRRREGGGPPVSRGAPLLRRREKKGNSGVALTESEFVRDEKYRGPGLGSRWRRDGYAGEVGGKKKNPPGV